MSGAGFSALWLLFDLIRAAVLAPAIVHGAFLVAYGRLPDWLAPELAMAFEYVRSAIVWIGHLAALAFGVFGWTYTEIEQQALAVSLVLMAGWISLLLQLGGVSAGLLIWAAAIVAVLASFAQGSGGSALDLGLVMGLPLAAWAIRSIGFDNSDEGHVMAVQGRRSAIWIGAGIALIGAAQFALRAAS